MIIYYMFKDMVKWLKEEFVPFNIAVWVIIFQMIVADFGMGRTCRRCKNYRSFQSCTFNEGEIRTKYASCRLSVTKKYFERR